MLSVYTRKRKRQGPSAKQMLYYKNGGGNALYSPSNRIGRRAFIPGKDRTGGYYGRFGRDGELKYHDFAYNQSPIGQGGSISPTNIVIPQGTEENSRIGRKCTIKSIFWRCILSLPERLENAAPGPGGDIVRVIVYLDKQCNGTAATTIDLLQAGNILTHRNLANSGRFVFLCDKQYTLNKNTLTVDTGGPNTYSSTPTYQPFTFYKKVNIPIEYSGTEGDLSEIRSNNLGHLVISNLGLIHIESIYRFRFSDN